MKKLSKGVVLGAILMLLMSQFAYTGVFADETPSPGPALPPVKVEPIAGGFADIGSFINNLARFIFILSIVLVFVYFLWGGLKWITSGGDKAATESARSVLTAALLGFAVIAMAYAIVRLIGVFFGVDIFGGFNIPTPPSAGEMKLNLCTDLGTTACNTNAGGNCTTADHFCYSVSGRNYCCPPTARQ